MIKPTVGRVVWYWPHGKNPDDNLTQPCAAIIAHVWNDRCINIVWFNANGSPSAQTSVTLMQEGDLRPMHPHAEWMPYQKGQAAATEALQKQIAG